MLVMDHIICLCAFELVIKPNYEETIKICSGLRRRSPFWLCEFRPVQILLLQGSFYFDWCLDSLIFRRRRSLFFVCDLDLDRPYY